jgi:hypothetical protein
MNPNRVYRTTAKNGPFHWPDPAAPRTTACRSASINLGRGAQARDVPPASRCGQRACRARYAVHDAAAVVS